jgi:superfamily II DNA or RNA helicase
MAQQINTILDNREGNTVLEALKRLLPESESLDVATGYFEIGSLLALDSYWNNLSKIRIVMGDETTKRTKNELTAVLEKDSTDSIEREKERDDSLKGLEAIRSAIHDGRISAKVYTKAKFHAKALLMSMKPPHLSNYGIVGSSNFTEPGLCRNLELNLVTTEQHQLQALCDWFGISWNDAEEVKDALLKVIEPHLKEYSPFTVYGKALYDYFLGKEIPVTTWEEQESVIYRILDDLQRIGYKQALRIAENYGGALICDGVGFGKTYIGLMLIERFLHERKRIALIVPKSTRESVWENRLQQFFKYKKASGFSKQILVLNHTDLHRTNEQILGDIESVKQEADVIIIDEAHHFRTPNAQRSEKLFDLMGHNGKKKKIYMLTATPVNNTIFDILHLMEYFTGKERKYFQKIGINDIRAYFVQKERAVEIATNTKKQTVDEEQLYPDYDVAAAEKVLHDDKLFREVVIQRSRSYAKEYFTKKGSDSYHFPERKPPIVTKYQLAKVYGNLFESLKAAFNKKDALVELALYNTENFKRDDKNINAKVVNRETQVLMLIRATLLKRMESSYKAFEASLEDLLRSMARFYRHYAPAGEWDQWKTDHEDFWNTLERHWRDRFTDQDEEEEVEEDDILPAPKEELRSDEFLIDEILKSVKKDMDELAEFLQFIHNNVSVEQDDKLRALRQLLESDDELRTKKIIIFTQYRDTARYLYRELKPKYKDDLEELDSTSKKNRESIIKRFAPYYNCCADELPSYLEKPIRILISTDVLSEGLNLQDGNLLINYDLHWNPVRLMQRIGRVDRRLDPEIEKKLGRDQNVVRFWNFLPPDELDALLHLYEKIAGKVLRISKTLGIEGKKLLRPEDDYAALQNMNAEYEGTKTIDEILHLRLHTILEDNPELALSLPKLPRRLFSGKSAMANTIKGVFACYRFPDRNIGEQSIPGDCRWYFHRIDTDLVVENIEEINASIESLPETPRVVTQPLDELRKSLKIIEQQCIQKELRNRQALAGEKATLVCWMEIS